MFYIKLSSVLQNASPEKFVQFRKNAWCCTILPELQKNIGKQYSGVSRTPSNISDELLAKVVNGFQPLTVFARNSVLDVWEGSEYASILKWRGTWVRNKIRANAIQILIVCYFTGNSFQKSLKFFSIVFIEIEIWLLASPF